LNKIAEDEEKAMRELFSSKIKKYRQVLGLSQFGLAEKADLSLNFVTDMEGGRSGASFATLIKLANALEIEAYELIMPDNTGGLGPGQKWGKDEIAWLSDGIRMTLEKMLGRKAEEGDKNAEPPPP